MIELVKIPTQLVEHFDNNGNSLGMLNADENIALRIQIKNNEQSGYFLIFEGEKIMIKSDGFHEKNPKGLFDSTVNLLNELFEI